MIKPLFTTKKRLSAAEGGAEPPVFFSHVGAS